MRVLFVYPTFNFLLKILSQNAETLLAYTKLSFVRLVQHDEMAYVYIRGLHFHHNEINLLRVMYLEKFVAYSKCK